MCVLPLQSSCILTFSLLRHDMLWFPRGVSLYVICWTFSPKLFCIPLYCTDALYLKIYVGGFPDILFHNNHRSWSVQPRNLQFLNKIDSKATARTKYLHRLQSSGFRMLVIVFRLIVRVPLAYDLIVSVGARTSSKSQSTNFKALHTPTKSPHTSQTKKQQ